MAFTIQRTDEIAAVLLLGLAAGVFFATRGYPGALAGTPGPAFFPRVIAATLAAMAVVQLGTALRADESGGARVSTEAARRIGVPIAFLIAYVLVLPLLGFFLTTSVFLAALMYYSGAQDLRVSLPLAVLVSVVLQNVFVGFLHVPLPAGEVPIRELFSLTVTGGVFA